MKGSYDPQRGHDSQVENHWSSTIYVGTHVVFVVVAVSLIPRSARTPLPGICWHVLLATLLGRSTPGPLMHSRSLSRAFPWEQAVADPLPQRTNPSLCTSWGSLAAPWRLLCQIAANRPLGTLCLKSHQLGWLDTCQPGDPVLAECSMCG